MKPLLFTTIALLLMHTASLTYAHDASYYKLAKIDKPTNNPSQSIGSYANGCLDGGVELPKNGDGFSLMRLTRERYYVHPNLYDFITKFSKKIKQAHPFKGIVIGDTGRAAGGPMPSGHASHQIGLDVDIWLRPAFNTILSSKERETISATSHVTKKQTIQPSWNQAYTNFVLTAAKYPETARIFVNPAIKKIICQQSDWKKDLTALAKIRPWYGHDAHMHVRLKCPKTSKHCIDQALPVRHHGCTGNDINWWFSDEALHPKPNKKTPKKPGRQKTFSDLPKQCQSLYNHYKASK
ncbi:MAG: penicillin-insensitive murein endopeptidase [Alphaproteobacteria bacterium]|jgi:penicillin-insensitive murein endopeptidase